MSFFFSFINLENRRAEQVLPGGICTSGRGEEMRKWCGRVNIEKILCIHVWKHDIF
jgi:hypothetical protein